MGFLLGKLSAPADALAGVGSFASVVVLHIAGGLLTFLLPVVPALWTDGLRQFTIHKERIAIVAPRTAEIYLGSFRGGGDGTVVEDIAVSYVLRCRGSGDIRIDLAMDGAAFKPSS